MNFKNPDCLIWIEDQIDATTLRWVHEGLPIDQVLQVSHDLMLNSAQVITFPQPYTLDASAYFGFLPAATANKTTITLDLGPLPRHTLTRISESKNTILCRDPLGGTIEYSRNDYSMPRFVDFPVKNMRDWQEYKKRFDPSDPRRYPKDYTREEYVKLFEESPIPTSMVLTGFYAFGRAMMGTAGFTPAFYTNPELVRDLMETWADFLVQVLTEIVQTLKSRIDWIFWWEDLAYGKGPNISPKVFKEFILPNLKKVTTFLNKNNIDLIIMDCDGDFRVLMPLLWDGGIRGTWPLEVNAGMDAVELRKEYGKTWRLLGNIDKRELLKGEEAIIREIDRKVPLLKDEGGYIPGLDHSIPPDVPLKSFEFYAKYLKEVSNY